MAKSNVSVPGAPPGEYVSFLEATADKYARCGFRFVPVVSPDQSLSCAIDILFLRRDHPGNLIKSSGDIDNRLNVIFDALQMPTHCQELPKAATVGADENPFYVLLENDSLITKVTVSTDRLLSPYRTGREHQRRSPYHRRDRQRNCRQLLSRYEHNVLRLINWTVA